jgi:UDPglucose 6-dehydrogenase
LETIRILTDAGMKIHAYDPEAGTNAGRVLADNPLVTIADDQYRPIEGAEALAVMTDWNQFRNPDFRKIKTMLRAPIIFDGRNLYSATYLADQNFTYFGIGRPGAH